MNSSLNHNNTLDIFDTFDADAKSEGEFGYTGGPERVVLPPGMYSFELYGANGGFANGGKGGYVSATFVATNTTELFLYVGGRGEDGTYSAAGSGGWNGGGNGGNGYDAYKCGAGGGGATDIRTVYGNWNENLEKRLIVAGGGGGGSGHGNQAGGNGGGLDGEASYKNTNNQYCPDSIGSYGGKKDSGYGYGFGQNGKDGYEDYCSEEGSGGGGGGWFGGYVKTDDSHTFGGGGGSGYVSPLLLNPVFANGRNNRDDGNGYVRIRKLHSINSKRCPTTHHSLVLEAMLFLIGEFEGG